MNNLRGFSLIELILFLGIVTITVFLAIPFLKTIPNVNINDSQNFDLPVTRENNHSTSSLTIIDISEINNSSSLSNPDKWPEK